VEDGTWMLWGNSSAAAAAGLARYVLDDFLNKITFCLHFFLKNDIGEIYV
jgi:hypothetical protein